MAPTIILDSQALASIAQLGRRGQQTLAAIRVLDRIPVVPAVVLTEVITGKPSDAAFHNALKGMEICPITEGIAIRAGALRERAEAVRRKKRDLTVDAIVVATAQEYTPAVIITADVEDMTMLAAGSAIKVAAV
jgi:predicted nucleic acid-binding protein